MPLHSDEICFLHFQSLQTLPVVDVPTVWPVPPSIWAGRWCSRRHLLPHPDVEPFISTSGGHILTQPKGIYCPKYRVSQKLQDTVSFQKLYMAAFKWWLCSRHSLKEYMKKTFTAPNWKALSDLTRGHLIVHQGRTLSTLPAGHLLPHIQ